MRNGFHKEILNVLSMGHTRSEHLTKKLLLAFWFNSKIIKPDLRKNIPTLHASMFTLVRIEFCVKSREQVCLIQKYHKLT